MSIGLLGQKVGVTQLYTEKGEAVTVTVIQAGPCSILQLKNIDRDGYEAVQVGFLDKNRKRAIKSERGHVAQIGSKRQKALQAAGVEPTPKAGCEAKKFIKEFRVPIKDFTVGQELSVEVFEDILAVDITATSKGCGYSGAMKRHNFSGQRASHGVKKCHRHLGSTGCSAYPSRTMKGKKMPGQYGNDQVTIRNQKVVMIDKENNLILIRGAVPGPNTGYVVINPTNRLPAPKTNKWKLTKKDLSPKKTEETSV